MTQLAPQRMQHASVAEDVTGQSSEQRFAPRRNDFSPAVLRLEETTFQTPCVVRDMSTTGAKLEMKVGWDSVLHNIADLGNMTLTLRQDRVTYPCKVVRRGETEVGVKFTSAPRPIERPAKRSKLTQKKTKKGLLSSWL